MAVPGGVEAVVLPDQLPHTGLGGGLGAGWEGCTEALPQSRKPPGQVAVPLELVHDERPLLVSVPVALLLQDSAEADLWLGLGLVTISGQHRFTNCLVFRDQGAMRQEALELRILLKRKFKLQLMTTVGLGRARICRRENSGSKLCSSGLATRTVAQRRRRLLLLLAQDWSPLFERVQQRHFPGLRLVTITVGQVSPGNSCGGAVLAMGGPSREASPLVQKVDRLHLWTSSILL